MSFRPTFRVVSGSGFNSSFGSKTSAFQSQGISGVGTKDHKKLTNRDAENQHPISAISGLTGELSVRPNSALSNMEIAEILAEV